ncbi:DUF2207 domain-containing protein [Roseburia hominis]
MRIRAKGSGNILLWIIIFVMISNMGIFSSLFGTSDYSTQITEDWYMTTDNYATRIEVQEDNSYQVTETIDVDFQNYRHGIYRYIPIKGVISEVKEDGKAVDIPYYASIDQVGSSDPLDLSTDNGNRVLRFGEEERELVGKKQYQFEYHVTPMTSTGYEKAYYNVFPTGWRNEIPAGSSFTIQFPKEIAEEQLRLYYGAYGEQFAASDIVDLSWDGTKVTGILNKGLPVGCGLTFYADVPKGYFQDVHTAGGINLTLILLCVVIAVILLVMFFLFGRDQQIIPSIQFTAPEGLDSAAVGYIIDGSVSDKDVMSLLIYWADRGYIKIRETRKNTLAFTKLRELPPDTPKYARTFFEGIFGRGEGHIGTEVKTSDLRYRMVTTLEKTKQGLHKKYSGLVYTQSSKVARGIAFVLTMIPIFVMVVSLNRFTFANGLVYLLAILYLAGVLLFMYVVDFWYSKAPSARKLFGSASVALYLAPLVVLLAVYGVQMFSGKMLNLLPALVGVAVVSALGAVLTGFMKKRTGQCVKWLGYLAGLRDFIVTAELDRMKVIAKDTPELFYHILPFAYVFGLSDILLDKMKELTIPAPIWYETRNGNPYFDYYLMHRMFHTHMAHVATTIATPKPSTSSGGKSSGGLGGGGFSGGGFSGGGFGGGGGGSW